jgi:hypothetical protein
VIEGMTESTATEMLARLKRQYRNESAIIIEEKFGTLESRMNAYLSSGLDPEHFIRERLHIQIEELKKSGGDK